MEEEGASRTALRLALDLLREEGLVKRRQGVGTVAVPSAQLGVPLDPPRSVLRLCEDGRDVVRYIQLSVMKTAISGRMAEHLEIEPSESAIFIERLIKVNNLPLSLACVWIPMHLGSSILQGRFDLAHIGIFDLLEQCLGLKLGISEYSIEATSADQVVGKLLEVPQGSPLLLLGTLTRLVDGRPASLGYTRARADRLRYESQGTGGWAMQVAPPFRPHRPQRAS